jgi:6-phosphogluconolactonase
LFYLDARTGELTSAGLVAETENPSFLAIHPNRRFLYAANEVTKFEGENSGAVSAFAIDKKNGKLKFLNRQASKGGAPCHLVVDKAGKNVLVANYVGGNIACLQIGSNGKLSAASSFIQHAGSSVNPRQKGPHAHSINLDAQNRFAVAADLGLDQLLIYRFDAGQGKFTANSPAYTSVAPGSGPRHFDFHPSGRFAYVINEMLLTVTAFAYDAKAGTLTSMQTVFTLPKGTKKIGSTAQILVHPSGRFLYGSNRGHDSIVAFSIDAKTGKLTYIAHQSTLGKTPRNFGIDPSGRFLLAANQSTNTIAVFRINQDTGELKPTGQVVDAPSPVCVVFVQ